MSHPSPQQRVAQELPPNGCRRLMARLEQMRAGHEHGAVGRLVLAPDGKLGLVLEEHYGWRQEDQRGGGSGSA